MDSDELFFEKLTMKNRNRNFKSQEFKLSMARTAQSLLGFTAIDYNYIGSSEVRTLYENYLKSFPMEQVRLESQLPSNPTPWNVMLVNFNEGFHIVSEKEYQPQDLVMPCYGELIKPEGVNFGDRMIKTSMGLILDSTQYSSLWIFALKSCQPNVKVEQEIVVDDKGKIKYVCYFSALTRIQIGDLLRVHPGDLRGDSNYQFKCTCQSAKCFSKKVENITCTIANCYRIGQPFGNKAALTTHIRKYHAAKEEHPIEKQSFPCDLCTVVCSTTAILNRHKKTKHLGIGQKECPWCGHMFARMETYRQHFNKFGCKGLAKTKK